MNLNDVARLKGCTMRGRSLETSCGCSSVDALLGGALPVSSFFCCDELSSKGYSVSLAKYFVAEGLYSGHEVLVVDPTDDDTIWRNVPSKMESPESPPVPAPTPFSHPDDLRIAFRYAARSQVESSVSEKNRYDMGKAVDVDALFPSQKLTFGGPFSYEALYRYLVELCQSERHSRTSGHGKNLLRIVISHLGSPLWRGSEDFSAFLVRVRALLRKSYAVLLVTTSSETMFSSMSEELLGTADAYIRLEAIGEEEQRKLCSRDKYHGFLRILRLPTITSIGTHNPPVDLVFTQKRNAFNVSLLHLPPAFGEADQNSKPSCNIDF
ncbi:hypothetical protein Q1695_007975 [Nippostrongylus brasiliensis]|nr:hypothetical protein Q1695_007975 [Nippostrongylus brasiliensis]